MGSSKTIFPFILFFFLCFPHFIASAKNCRNNRCGQGEPLISYPFRIIGRQDERCGFPGFDLTCDELNRTVLEMPFSGRFFVKSIRYNEIQLQDPDNCLTRRYLNQLNLSSTPFFGINFIGYSFYNCSSNAINYYSGIISCLSSSKHTVVATSTKSSDWSLLDRKCVLIGTRRLPGRSSFLSYNSTDLHLYWERKESPITTSDQIDIKKNLITPSKKKSPSKNKKNLISIGIIIPFIFGSVMYCTSCCGIYSDSQYVSSSGAVQTTPQSVITTTTGLGGPAIQSFPMVVLGESGRLPDPNINTCAICLSEFQPKETLKTLPVCNHCFHADCIDVWLRLKSTCPVCRKSPVP